MQYRAKLWTSLSAIALTAATGVAASSLATPHHATASQAMPNQAKRGAVQLQAPWLQFADSGVASGEGGEGGQGGEGGEGGFDPTAAASDPTVFLSALDVIRAHYLAGLAVVGENREAAGELFAHPISEVYVNLEPVFLTLGVAPFEDKMAATVDLAYSDADGDTVAAAARQVLTALDAAETKAPASVRSRLGVEADVLAEMIDRAALQYRYATESAEPGEAWLDGYGFYKTAQNRGAALLPQIENASAEAGEKVRAALDLLAEAYPSATPPADRPVTSGQLLAASSNVKLQIGQL